MGQLLFNRRVQLKKVIMVKAIQGFLIAACLVFLSVPVLARDYGQFGPFDYYDLENTPKNALPLVESGHFGPKTQNLAREGNWCFYWSDLDYTLRAFPNHPGALMAMADYLREHPACKTKMPEKRSVMDLANEMEAGGWQEKTADYYFETAINFRPKHAATRVLYGRYLHQEGRLNEALKIYVEAEKQDPKSADVHYYLGLLYLDTGNSEKAKHQADLAYKLGQPLPELRDRLTKAGLWKTN